MCEGGTMFNVGKTIFWGSNVSWRKLPGHPPLYETLKVNHVIQEMMMHDWQL